MKKIKYYTSLWNYIYHDEPQSLEEVVGQVRNEGFGVELWPYFFSLKPYRPTLQTRPISIKRGFNDLFDITYREQLQDLFSGVETSWHSRGTGEKPLKISTFQEHAQQIDTAAAIGSSIISVHDIGYTLTNTQVTNNVTVANQVVEYATTRFMSTCTKAMLAAMKAVKPPTKVTTNRATSDNSNKGEHLTTRKTPAVTIVAAWIKAETGVGPSIASANQVCKPI